MVHPDLELAAVLSITGRRGSSRIPHQLASPGQAARICSPDIESNYVRIADLIRTVCYDAGKKKQPDWVDDYEFLFEL